MNDKIVYTIIVIALAYIIAFGNSFGNNKSSSNQSNTVPSGTAGLEYLKKQYASDLAKAQSLCSSQFKGNWVDTSNSIGCYSMQGFSTYYCGVDVIQNLVNVCKSIGGTPTCSSTQASCSV